MKRLYQVTVADSEGDYRKDILLTSKLNEIQFEFANFVMNRLWKEDGNYYAKDWLSKPFNEKNPEKISNEDVSFVFEKLYRIDFIESDREGLRFKLGTSGKEMMQIHGSYEDYIEFEIERLEDEFKENENRKVIDRLNLKQLKWLVFQAKWWWAIMILNTILSIAAAYLLFRLGINN